jgi:type I restriction enzyme S subunit
MSVTTEEPVLPKLRFPNFKEQWKHEELESITSKKISYGIVQAGEHIPGGMPYIKSQDLNKPLTLDSLQRTSTEIARKYSRSEVEPGDIVFSLRGNIGVCQIVPSSISVANLTQGTARIAVTSHDNRLVAQTLQTTKVAREIDASAKGSTFREISLEALRKISLALAPTLPEQRKIADFLTAVDGRIGQLSQKKALLEDYKKGVMQQLFTQALRFKDDHGNDFPDWEEKKYSEIYTFQNTNSYSRDLLTYEGGEVRNIHYGDIHTKFRSNFYLSQEVVPFIKPEVELKRIAKDCYCRVGDLVIADASEDYADVGKCIEIMELGEKTLAGLHTFIARPKKGAMSPGFGGYLMQSREVRLKIMTIAQGTKVLGLSKNMLCNIKLPIPHPEEQTKIANFLTALDRKIESMSQQITHTQAFKKGLLQQMFV